MKPYIAFDSHKQYTFASVSGPDGEVLAEARVPHTRGAVREFLAQWPPGSPVAVETIGNWYWLVDEIEAAGMVPTLVHARKAKLMMGMINKTDKLDARGLNRLQQTGTLPTVWIPPGDLRDQRDLPRTRMVLSAMRTRLKNRLHATLAKYALSVSEVSDLFGVTGRRLLGERLRALPPHTRYASEQLVEQLAGVEAQIAAFEVRMRAVFQDLPDLVRLRSVPGVGEILGVVLLVEVGDVARFPGPAQLAAYAGTTPRVHASGGKTRMGQLRGDVNRYLKWAFVEAANVISLTRRRHPERHVSQLYTRIATRKGHAKAIGAVARHLAEATYWILTRQEAYQAPRSHPRASTERAAREPQAS